MSAAIKIKSYWRLARMHRPAGILLLLWPTLWALWLALRSIVSLKLLFIFTFGVVLMRAAGCVINDIADRRFDGNVWRTKDRPLVAGELSLKEAALFLMILLILAASLLLWLPPITWLLAIVGLAITIVYPFLKRYTHLPQLILGIAFAWGIPMAFAAATDSIPLLAWYLFLITAIWIVMYDTEYAMADREDDLKIGVKSTAILFGRYDRLIIGLFQATMLVLLLYLGRWLSLNIFYYFSIMLAASFFIFQQILIYSRKREKCLYAFLNNQWVGLIIFLGIMLGSNNKISFTLIS